MGNVIQLWFVFSAPGVFLSLLFLWLFWMEWRQDGGGAPFLTWIVAEMDMMDEVPPLTEEEAG